MTIAGIDEVGRGAWAGPLVAACVVFDHKYKINDSKLPVKIDDSKKLTPRQRAESSEWIIENALSIGLGKATPRKINKKGLSFSLNYVFRKSLGRCTKNLLFKPRAVLVDGIIVPDFEADMPPAYAIVKGDQKEFVIASASIVAKVWRDSYMEALSQKAHYSPYLWHKNKGYGTKEHVTALKQFGPTKHHRSLFIRNYI